MRSLLRREGALHVGALALLVAGGAALRISDLFAPLRYDETYTFFTYAFAPLDSGLSNYSLPNNHLLHTLLVHIDWRLFGDREWVLRLPALVAGIALIPATYAAGRLLYGRDAGIVAAGLVAASSPLVQFSVNARGYTLGALFFMTAIAFGARALDTGGRGAWAGFAASCVLAVYSVPVMAIAVGVVASWIALEALVSRSGRDRAAALRGLALALAGAALVSLALYAPTLGDDGWFNSYEDPLGTLYAAGGLAKVVLREWHAEIPALVDFPLVLAFFGALAFHRRLARHAVPIVATVAAAAIGLLIVGRIPPFSRTWLWLAPLYFMVAGAGVAAAFHAALARLGTRSPAAGPALAVALAAVLAVTYLSAGDKPFDVDAPTSDDGVARYVRDRFPGQPILAYKALTPNLYYFARDGVPGLSNKLTPGQRASRRALVIAQEYESPFSVVRLARGAQEPGSYPRLIKRWRWIGLYEVRLAPS